MTERDYQRWLNGKYVAIEIKEKSGKIDIVGIFGVFSFNSVEEAEQFLLQNKYVEASL